MSISSSLCDVYHLLEIMWRKKNSQVKYIIYYYNCVSQNLFK